ncbi:MAG: oxidoreductase, partial [Acaryochloridaceae cyanobacterium CSU_5_19]|nr:oxidoreductase [Acaryochloridaceae cyanobacterium CSU_5_19]
MSTQSAPLISLQAPKNVSLSDINAELSQIWTGDNASGNGSSTPAALRAATFSLVVYEPEETQQLLAALGFYTGPVDGIYGPRMEAALRSAQDSYDLPVTGKVNAETLEQLRQAWTDQQVNPREAQSNQGSRYTLDAGGAGIADAIATQSPCRVISLFPMGGE